MSKGFRSVSRSEPCPACGKPDWCAWTSKGLLRCERTTDPPANMRLIKPAGSGGLFAPASAVRMGRTGRSGGRNPKKPVPSGVNWAEETQRLSANITPAALQTLADKLGVTVDSLQAIGCGWATETDLHRFRAGGADWGTAFPPGAYTFPERDGTGTIVGLSLRAPDGRKGAPAGAVGARRGLIIPSTMNSPAEPILVVEGASDVAAAHALGLTAIGRPSATGGAEFLARLLGSKQILVVGENDAKEHGGWPGRDGAERIASRLATSRKAEVGWSVLPDGQKDLRAWVAGRVAKGLSLTDREACHAAGQELLKALIEAQAMAQPEPPAKQSELIVRLAIENFRIGRSDGDEPFAVRRDGPNIALMFRGSSDAMRATLAREFRRRYGRVPNASAMSDALTTLHGEALECTPEPLHLRLARHDGAIVLDLGTPDGAVVMMWPGRWEVRETSPVLFRRTALTGALPMPEPHGDLDCLREILNVREDYLPLVKGILVASLIPDIPHPVVLLNGEQGTGKTTFATFVTGLFDPSPAPVRSPPRDPEQWAVAAAGSYAVVLDNISSIPPWLSDALCKACTGDGWLRRRLYTDGDIAVLSFRRVVFLTSIDTGALRGDLADRLVSVMLERIDDARRLTEAKLKPRYREKLPRMMGGLFDLACRVLKQLGTLEETPLPRMADFGRVLLAMDRELGTDSMAKFLAQRDLIASDVVDDDPVGPLLIALLEQQPEFVGNMKELDARLRQQGEPGPGWPKTARGLSGAIRRLAPALSRRGIEVTPPAMNDRTRRFTLRSTARTARPPGTDADSALGPQNPGRDGRAVVDGGPPDRPPDRPAENPSPDLPIADFGRSGGLGGQFQHTSGPAQCAMCGRSEAWRLPGQSIYTCCHCHPPAPGLAVEHSSNGSQGGDQ